MPLWDNFLRGAAAVVRPMQKRRSTRKPKSGFGEVWLAGDAFVITSGGGRRPTTEPAQRSRSSSYNRVISSGFDVLVAQIELPEPHTHGIPDGEHNGSYPNPRPASREPHTSFAPSTTKVLAGALLRSTVWSLSIIVGVVTAFERARLVVLRSAFRKAERERQGEGLVTPPPRGNGSGGIE